MHVKIVSQAPLDIVTLDEAKSQCRLMPSFTLDDDRLNLLIQTATQLAQNYTSKQLSLSQVSMLQRQYSPNIYLFGGEVGEIVSASCYTQNGKVMLTESDYIFNPITQSVSVNPKYAQCVDFVFDYECGYETVPAQVKQGILLLVSTMYNATEDYLIGLTHENLPYTSLALLNSVRDYHA